MTRLSSFLASKEASAGHVCKAYIKATGSARMYNEKMADTTTLTATAIPTAYAAYSNSCRFCSSDKRSSPSPNRDAEAADASEAVVLRDDDDDMDDVVLGVRVGDDDDIVVVVVLSHNFQKSESGGPFCPSSGFTSEIPAPAAAATTMTASHPDAMDIPRMPPGTAPTGGPSGCHPLSATWGTCLPGWQA